MRPDCRLTCKLPNADVLRVVHVVEDAVFVALEPDVDLLGAQHSLDPQQLLHGLGEEDVSVLLHAHVLRHPHPQVCPQGLVAVVTEPRPASLTLCYCYCYYCCY